MTGVRGVLGGDGWAGGGRREAGGDVDVDVDAWMDGWGMERGCSCGCRNENAWRRCVMEQ
jgi:hypothetical protein